MTLLSKMLYSRIMLCKSREGQTTVRLWVSIWGCTRKCETSSTRSASASSTYFTARLEQSSTRRRHPSCRSEAGVNDNILYNLAQLGFAKDHKLQMTRLTLSVDVNHTTPATASYGTRWFRVLRWIFTADGGCTLVSASTPLLISLLQPNSKKVDQIQSLQNVHTPRPQPAFSLELQSRAGEWMAKQEVSANKETVRTVFLGNRPRGTLEPMDHRFETMPSRAWMVTARLNWESLSRASTRSR